MATCKAIPECVPTTRMSAAQPPSSFKVNSALSRLKVKSEKPHIRICHLCCPNPSTLRNEGSNGQSLEIYVT